MSYYRPLLIVLALFILWAPGTARARTATPVVVFQLNDASAEPVAQKCHEIWQAEGPGLARALLPAGARADTVVCALLDTQSFRHFFAGRLPDWGVGAAMPTGQVVAVDYTRLSAVGRGLREVFLHEMVHALLFQGGGDAWLPTWLHEGTAMHYSGEWRFSDTVSLILDGHVPNLAQLQGRFPASAATADRAYRASLLAVRRLIDTHGDTVIGSLVESASATGDFDRAFFSVTGQTADGFAAEFAGSMRLRYGWLVLITRWPALFVLMAVVFAVGASRKLILTRRRLADMPDDSDDPDESPPYDAP